MSGPTSAGGGSPSPRIGLRGLGRESLIFVALVLLTLVGIGIADFSSQYGLEFWLLMVPAFAGASIAAGWTRARERGETWAMVRRQVFHWLPLPLAFYLIYLLEDTGRLNREDGGLVALIALAITTLLAGVHFDWRLAVLGVLLALAATAAALVEEFFWMLVIPAVLAAAVVVFWHRKDAAAETGGEGH